MQEIVQADIIQRIRLENPWWGSNHAIRVEYQAFTPRAYFDLFFPLIVERSVRRAVVLMGPRRVGKTVMIYHAIQSLLANGVRPESICYFSVDHPIYNGLSLEKLLQNYGLASSVDYKSEPSYIFFDEIQYLRNWEISLKSAVDSYPNIKFIASGSAAAALRLKSGESGAGRFTDFALPPLTFYEYLSLLGKTGLLEEHKDASDLTNWTHLATDIEQVNKEFLQYLNFGGYPEVIFSPQIQSDPARFIKSDIIDKVLLRDLPSLYGIGDIQELNYLFTTLAFNTANEISLEELSRNSGVAKNTIKRYIEYLEAAFLIKVVHRVDHSAKRFRRANYFKVYLTNPSMRAALFSPLKADDSAIGSLIETAIYSQWFHSNSTTLFYARWKDGEVDIVNLGGKQSVLWAVEVKWSDRFCEEPDKLSNLVSFCKTNGLKDTLVTCRTKTMTAKVDGTTIRFVPAAVYCYTVGYNLVQGRKNLTLVEQLEARDISIDSDT
jgi:uncharacterized protein